MSQMRQARYFLGILIVILAGIGNPAVVGAQDIPGTLVFEEPFEGDELLPGWYMVQNNNATAELLGMIESGPNGGSALVITTNTPDTVTLTNLQFSTDNFPRPEGSDQYEWRVMFWVRTLVVPFTIVPIMAMSEDPWTGSSLRVTIEEAKKWTFVDVVLPVGDFLTTDPLLLIFHMGNPGDENGENEVWFDDIKVYLLNQPTSVNDWSVY